MGRLKPGFTIIEIMVALVIIAMMATMVIPNLQKLSPRYDREQFVSQLNALVGFTWQNAIIEHKFHKIFFDTEKKIVKVEIASDKTSKTGEPVYEPIKRAYITTTISIPDEIKIQDFFIEGHNAIKEGKRIWFFIVPDGLSQEVIINFWDGKDLIQNKPRPFGLVLNPFVPQFKMYDEFKS